MTEETKPNNDEAKDAKPNEEERDEELDEELDEEEEKDDATKNRAAPDDEEEKAATKKRAAPVRDRHTPSDRPRKAAPSVHERVYQQGLERLRKGGDEAPRVVALTLEVPAEASGHAKRNRRVCAMLDADGLRVGEGEAGHVPEQFRPARSRAAYGLDQVFEVAFQKWGNTEPTRAWLTIDDAKGRRIAIAQNDGTVLAGEDPSGETPTKMEQVDG